MIDLLESVDEIVEKRQLVDYSMTHYSSSVVEIIWSPELKQIEKNHLEEIVDLIKELGQGKKMLVYFSTHDLLTLSKEARKYGASSDAQENTLANAVLTNSLATKLIFNFFMRVNKPITPTKSFSNREAAIDWLLKKKK